MIFECGMFVQTIMMVVPVVDQQNIIQSMNAHVKQMDFILYVQEDLVIKKRIL